MDQGSQAGSKLWRWQQTRYPIWRLMAFSLPVWHALLLTSTFVLASTVPILKLRRPKRTTHSSFACVVAHTGRAGQLGPWLNRTDPVQQASKLTVTAEHTFSGVYRQFDSSESVLSPPLSQLGQEDCILGILTGEDRLNQPSHCYPLAQPSSSARQLVGMSLLKQIQSYARGLVYGDAQATPPEAPGPTVASQPPPLESPVAKHLTFT
eukprot:scaffold178380_cov25-Prasinocladus_malaysianus.AAC.1